MNAPLPSANPLFASDDPYRLFGDWLELARGTPGIADATAMSLATASATGQPSVRIVLLKGFDARGFVFYTNLESRKSEEMRDNPRAALCFYWAPLDRQVRIGGRVEPGDTSEADAYFASRDRERQIGAWTSRQSRTLARREQFEEELRDMAARFGEGPIARPQHWGGWRLIPDEIEFWIQMPHRLHERRQFLRQGESWRDSLLYP